jgi:toxin ParE1/3/4
MIQIQLSKLAQQDLKDIWRGLAEYRLELADKQIKRIEKKIVLLKQFPLAGRQRDDIDSAIRSVTVDRFVVFYQIHEQTDGTIVEIVRVTDGRRDLNRLFSDDDEDEEAP